MKRYTSTGLMSVWAVLIISLVTPDSALALDSINPEQVGQNVASNGEQTQIDQTSERKMSKLMARLGVGAVVVGAAF